MSNWFYYNEKGEKIAVTGGQLKGLAKTGLITPGTMVETEDGKTAPARKVKGLTFITPESTPSATAPPAPSQPVESEIYGLSKSKLSSERSMPNYLYTDENGTKYSLPKQRLQTLIDRGVITQNTPLETDTGQIGLAGQIPGLQFNTVFNPAMMPQNVSVPVAGEDEDEESTNATNPVPIFIGLGIGLFVLVVIVIGMSNSGGGSFTSLVGRWGDWSTKSGVSPESLVFSMELWKDGTGIADGDAVTWKTKGGRLYLTHSGTSRVTDWKYKISGSELTLINDKGDDLTLKRIK